MCPCACMNIIEVKASYVIIADGFGCEIYAQQRLT